MNRVNFKQVYYAISCLAVGFVSYQAYHLVFVTREKLSVMKENTRDRIQTTRDHFEQKIQNGEEQIQVAKRKLQDSKEKWTNVMEEKKQHITQDMEEFREKFKKTRD